MVTVLHLVLRHFHHFTELKKNLGYHTSLAQSSTCYNTITASYFKYRSAKHTEFQVTKYSKHCKSQLQALAFNMLQEKQFLTNVRNNSIR